MKKKILAFIGAVLLLIAAFGIFNYANYSMDAPEVIRKLSGLRLAVAMFRQAKHRLPADIGEVIGNGNLESVPELKFRLHFATAKVRNTSELTTRDTGGWAYVNDPKSRDFGTIFIDCAQKDEKGRYWSEF